jgi:hypothetical protein
VFGATFDNGINIQRSLVRWHSRHVGSDGC